LLIIECYFLKFKIVDYFYRIEYQARGAPHVHMKLWQEGAPVFGKSSLADVIKFIDKYITCALPNPHSDPYLYELVNKFQQHSCTKSCKRMVKKKNKVIVKCRYGFPKSVQESTAMNTLEETIKSSKFV
jgi:hypothetical protein